jgi:hypothetical protein
MFAAGCRSDSVDQFIKFIGIVATMDCSTTPAITVMSLRNLSSSHYILQSRACGEGLSHMEENQA